MIDLRNVSVSPPLPFVGGTTVPKGDVGVVFLGLSLVLELCQHADQGLFSNRIEKGLIYPHFFGVLFSTYDHAHLLT